LPFSFAVVQHKRSVLNEVLDFSLQRAAVRGGIDDALRQEILTALAARGFDPAEATITPSAFLTKNRGEMIEITIAVPGKAGTLAGVRALGGEPPPENWLLLAEGSIMSEKIP